MNAPSSQRQFFSPVSFIRKLWHTHAPLTLLALVMTGLTLFFIAGIFLDSRIITGAPAWLKPTKFGISITIYVLTLTWLLSLIEAKRPRTQRLIAIIGWVVAGVFVVEMIAIVGQVIRGTTSHFNVATPLDAFLFSMMGTAIVILWLTNLLVAALLLRQKFENPAFAWALRLGLIIAIIGMGEGFLMTSPTAQQLAGWEAGGPVTVAGAHSVGVPDGGPGLPVVNWSTAGGDLRIGHFVGMHALQVLPFFAFFVTRRRRLSHSQQTSLVWTAASFYLGLTLLLTWQALRAQPIIAPDALTLGVFAGLVSAVAVTSTLILRLGSSQRMKAQTQHQRERVDHHRSEMIRDGSI